ncbi:MAG: alpha/beta fold hydrolase, partial [Cyclobacteriaceae bacterium]|nr:alpha/beta fold hydrolase [Cyclobacteriaceae bacterium]
RAGRFRSVNPSNIKMKMITSLILSVIAFALAILFLLYYVQDKLIFFPQKLDPDYQFGFRESFEERFFRTEENVRIHALHFKVKQPRGLVYYLHGNAGSLQGWGTVAGDFTDQQYDVLMIDYRGYGKSHGKISEPALLHDALAIFDTLKTEYGEKKIIVYGRSLGTGMASYVASQRDPGLLILESPYYNLPDASRSYFPWFPSFLIRYKFRNDLYLAKTRCPVHVFHGSRDEVIDVRGSYQLKSVLKPEDSLYIIEGGHHNDLALFDEYGERLQEILIRF